MGRGHPGIPPKVTTTLSKSDLLSQLAMVDSDVKARDRVLTMEVDFRSRVETAIAALPLADAKFDKFKTSPYVLLLHSALNGYSQVSQIEHDILPAKLFSSIETSSGKMIELVTLPVYGWETVPSQMHSAYSALDGKYDGDYVLYVASLKSGPACLNDEMAENFADAVLSNVCTWAGDAGVSRVDFTYGVLYGTPSLSNKKDWHILRNLEEKAGESCFSVSPQGSWTASFMFETVEITATVRIGLDWWSYLGETIGVATAGVEVWTALIRACIAVGVADPTDQAYVIRDLGSIVQGVPDDFNVSLLQAGQLPWLFFVARHFCDALVD